MSISTRSAPGWHKRRRNPITPPSSKGFWSRIRRLPIVSRRELKIAGESTDGNRQVDVLSRPNEQCVGYGHFRTRDSYETRDYLELVDWSGLALVEGKRGLVVPIKRAQTRRSTRKGLSRRVSPEKPLQQLHRPGSPFADIFDRWVSGLSVRSVEGKYLFIPLPAGPGVIP